MIKRTFIAGALCALAVSLTGLTGASAQLSPNTPGVQDLPTSIPQSVLTPRPDLEISDSVLNAVAARSCSEQASFKCGPGYACTDVWQAGRNIRYSCEPIGGSTPAGDAVCSHGYASPSGDGYICVLPQ